MKSKNLEILSKNRINIPDFKVFSFDNLISNSSFLYELLDDFKKNNFKDIELYSQKLKKIIEENFVKPDLEDINFEKCSIRSSCNLEDSDSYSFAGIFETYLDIEKSDIPSKMSLCLQSIYSKRAMEYMVLQNLDIKLLKMDIIVQKMIYPQYSGILFSSNPQGILNETVITVGRGIGELVVSDKIETTSYYYNLSDKSYYYTGREDIISIDILEGLLLNSEKIKDILNLKYVDIEFCVENSEIYILQARPITSIDDSYIVILDNSNIVESYPNISLPLTQSFAQTVYTGVFRGVAGRILKNNELSTRYEDVYKNMITSINGSIYYQINNWYKLLQFLPMNKKIIPVWQEMLGIKNKDYNLEHINLPFLSKVKTYFSFIYEMIKTPKNMKILNKKFDEVYFYFKNSYKEDLENEKLRDLYFEIKNRLINIWDITLINDMYAFIFTGLLKHKLKKRYPQDYKEKSISIISGIQNVESMKPINELLNIAMLSLDKKNKDKYQKAYNNYIELYGDRTVEELKLESETFRINPKLLDDKIKEYTSNKDKLSKMIENLKEHKDINSQEKMDFYAKNAMLGIKNREISRLNRTRIFGMVRSIFLSIGKNFEKEKLIENYRDIFYLSIDEVFEIIDSKKDVKYVVKQRKQEYSSYEQIPKYSRLILTNTNIKKIHKFINKNESLEEITFLQGLASSVGKTKGKVVVIDNPNQNIDVKEKIIVAKMTDPGWIFMLANAKGIIAEKGSLLSHTAIISRELKIPAIVGVDRVTEILKTGDEIIMDANSGIIKVLR